MSIDTFSIALIDAYLLSPKTKHFTFRCDLTPPFHYIPGQFITLHFDHEDKPLRRSYSIANVPEQNNCIEIAASYIEGGPGTQLLFNLKPGDILQASGPYGRLTLRDSTPKRYIFVATTTGITPFRAMKAELIQRIQQDEELQIVLLQGTQTANDLLYRDEFLALTAQYPQISFHACLSQADTRSLRQNEHAGYVQSIFPELNLNPSTDVVYLCGNPAMIDDAFLYLKEKGFAIEHIIREKYISR